MEEIPKPYTPRALNQAPKSEAAKPLNPKPPTQQECFQASLFHS